MMGALAAAELGARVPAGFQARDHVAAAGGVRVEASEYQPPVFDLEQEQMLVAHRDAAGGQGVGLHRDDDGVACVDDLVGVVAEVPPFLTDLLPEGGELLQPDVGSPVGHGVRHLEGEVVREECRQRSSVVALVSGKGGLECRHDLGVAHVGLRFLRRARERAGGC